MSKGSKEGKRLHEKAVERKAANKPFTESVNKVVMPGGVQLSLFLKDWKGIE